MNVKGITQAELTRKSGLSKTTVSRICRNSNDKGSSYLPTLPIIMSISVGLQLTRAQASALLFSAFPEMALWGGFLDERMDIDQANEILHDAGLPLLGGANEE